MEYEIYKLFDSYKFNELLLFYFFGYGIINFKGNLFIVIFEMDKNEWGIVIFLIVVEVSYLNKCMNDSSLKY